MCLAIPSKIIEIEEFRALVDVYGARREVNLMLLPEAASVGDYVLVHAGFAIQKVEQEPAQEALRMITAIIEEMEKEEEGAAGPPS